MLTRALPVRRFSKVGDALEIPSLNQIQVKSYAAFLQEDVEPRSRARVGLEGLLHEVFPIESYDGNVALNYVCYELAKPRFTPDECRELRLTYGKPLRIRLRMTRKDSDEVLEDLIYVGELPIMMGGGEFIINGAERVIVSQLHRSPGVDFVKEQAEGDRALHGCRIIPERGSWIEVNVTKKDLMAVRIDQSSKIAATAFLRAMSEKYSTDESIIREFFQTKQVKLKDLTSDMYVVSPVVEAGTGTVLVQAGCQIGDAIGAIQQGGSGTKIEVIAQVQDPIILNTLAEDSTHSHEEALLKIYARLRPGNPPALDKAKKLFHEKFYDENRYRLGKVGRFRMNRKLDINSDESVMVLRVEDYVACLRYMLHLRAGDPQYSVDDIDHLGNRRLRTLDELCSDELRKGFLKLRRTVQERMSLKNPDEIGRIAQLINSKSISSAVEFFFGRSELSQVVDQTNPLSQLTHERRLSALGPGGLNRKRAGFEVRDVHISHYGRICPIETPEGTNIGLIASLSIYSSVDEYGFLRTPYIKVDKSGKLDEKASYLRADEEMRLVLAPPEALDPQKRRLQQGAVIARAYGELAQVDSKQVDYLDISPKQTVGVSAALIPFLEHDDANRALMGSNMQRQAVPLLRTDPPVVATGMEKVVPINSGMVVQARYAGTVTYVDASRIVLNDTDEYVLRKYRGLNERTCLNQRPLVKPGQKVKAGEIIADGPATYNGELALGRNVLVAFMTFDGYNFEDAILISEKLVREDVFTSIHIDAYDVEVRETKLGKEEFTADIPNVSERALRNLDERGIVRTGTVVSPGDILVGKVSPKSKTELSPEEKLLHAIFGRAGEDVKNDSLELPAGEEGVVIGAKHFSRRMNMSDEEKKQLEAEVAAYREAQDARVVTLFRQMCEEIEKMMDGPMIDPNTRQKVGHSPLKDVILEQVKDFGDQVRTRDLKWVKPASIREQVLNKVVDRFWSRIEEIIEERERKTSQMKRGDELPTGVLEMVKVYVATKRALSVGDKMAGRHGNKGVIARIMPEEDMPFLEDGTPVDIVLNPLGVPSRMNVGQILETYLGWAAKVLGFQAVTPVFDGAKEEEIHELIRQANAHVQQMSQDAAHVARAGAEDLRLCEMPVGGKTRLRDGRTGEYFDQRVTVGYLYMLKLHHLVDDKIHVRSTGPYSLITQQPLGGKARTGGQRFGEMEVWGLEAYGASHILQELLTVKSDDVEGRTKIYEAMVKGSNTLEAGTPVSFDVLCNEIRGLCMNIHLEKPMLI
ncbi:MAG: DNA-directed RNA polymerase subunit beta [Phycisphaerae bacterium]|nr:MAG: DNA-directed RNA polymerase subunit beta [Planctomycetota bacterium]KAB2949261.1 MAG: DNA-directed RNA polymerase subunit beta [Phycisphaerae bacterium]MBE7455672.1 DNA-directed RNA polymerase subunit beta [Planctomycetia bacterium]MCK6463308.1 DNA-directed RNA polymerase subunit beta [Phycisphaerae bacterium]MCL4716930.1 DNA-directed RNA polymerase subunit beta [Phycisphaerae bacterium]